MSGLGGGGAQPEMDCASMPVSSDGSEGKAAAGAVGGECDGRGLYGTSGCPGLFSAENSTPTSCQEMMTDHYGLTTDTV